MNKKAKQLRELRNKIIYNGDVPLEFGCEIIDVETQKAFGYCGCGFNVYDTYIDISKGNGLIDTVKRIGIKKFISIGKPTSWGDILRMLADKPINISLRYKTLVINENTKDEIITDLTKSPEEQDDEVLEKLINLI